MALSIETFTDTKSYTDTDCKLNGKSSSTNMGKSCARKFVAVPEALKRSIQATRAEYRQLGRSGLRVSNPILGGLQIGDSRWFPWILDEEKALILLKAAYDRGVNTWDTANIYSNGESERLMGKALREYNIPRRKVVIMTKCYRIVCDEEAPDPGSGVAMHGDLADQSKDYVNQWGLSRSAIFTAVEASLKRLQTNYIDVLQIHRYDSTVPPEETMEALHDLVKAGKVRYLGASSMWCYQFQRLQHVAEKNGWTKFISMQNHYNLLYREEEREMLRFCRETGVGVIPWAPLASGQLARPLSANGSTIRSIVNPKGCFYTSPNHPAIFSSSTASSSSSTSISGVSSSSASPTVSTATNVSDIIGQDKHIETRNENVISSDDLIISRVQQIADRRGWPMSHVALAWLNKRVTAPIVGFSSVDRMDEALGALSKELTAEEETWLEEGYVSKGILGHE